MERKIRNRVSKKDAKLLLIKLLPWIFFLIMLMATTSLASAGPHGSEMD